jgi:transposase
MESTTIAVDLANSVFEVAVSRRPGQVTGRHRLSRGQFARFPSGRHLASYLGLTPREASSCPIGRARWPDATGSRAASSRASWPSRRRPRW